jgi:gas vesicle protein
MSKKSGALGVAIGVAVGVTLGIMMAPDKGSNTRGKIKDGYGGAKRKIKDKIASAKNKFANMDFEGTYNEVFADVQDKKDEVINFLESKLAALKSESDRMK